MSIAYMKNIYVYTWQRYEISIPDKDITFLYLVLYTFNVIYAQSIQNCFYFTHFRGYIHVP